MYSSVEIHNSHLWLTFLKNCEYLRVGVRCEDALSRKHYWFVSAKNDELHSLKVLHTSRLWLLHASTAMCAVHQHCHCPITVCSVSSLTVTFSIRVYVPSASLGFPEVNILLADE